MNKKLPVLLISILLVVLCFSGCTNTEKQNNNSIEEQTNDSKNNFNESSLLYTNYTHSYSIQLKENWTVEEGNWHAILSKNDTTPPRLVIQISNPTELNPDLFATFEETVERNLEGFAEMYSLANYNLTSANYTTFKGFQAHDATFIYISGSKNFKDRFFSFVREDIVYHFWVKTYIEFYDEYLNEINQIIDSFTFL
jgi:hypothetical protein